MVELQAATQPRSHIAIVDDDAPFADSLAALLRASEIPCVAFADVARLLASLHERRYLAVLLDVHMPAPGGSAAIRAILDVEPTQRIVSITTHADESDVAQLRAAGARAVLIKPFLLKDLLKTLAEA